MVNFDIWFIAKIMVMFALLLYLVFSYVIIKQTKIMTKTLELGFENVVKTISLIHFVLAVGTFILALVIL